LVPMRASRLKIASTPSIKARKPWTCRESCHMPRMLLCIFPPRQMFGAACRQVSCAH